MVKSSGNVQHLVKSMIFGAIGVLIVQNVVAEIVKNVTGLAATLINMFSWLLSAVIMIAAIEYL